jgi:hypothetical protein
MQTVASNLRKTDLLNGYYFRTLPASPAVTLPFAVLPSYDPVDRNIKTADF